MRALADDPELSSDAWRERVDAALAAVAFRLGPDDTVHSAAGGWDGIVDELLPAAVALGADRARMRRCGNRPETTEGSFTRRRTSG